MADKQPPGLDTRKKRLRNRILGFLILLLLALLALLLVRACRPHPPEDLTWVPAPSAPPILTVPMPDLPPDLSPEPPPEPKQVLPSPARVDTPVIPAAVDSVLPYLYADPWGGRHFDSVTVSLYCREDCLILYSLEDSVNLKTYSEPLTLRRNATLWLSGLDTRNRQVEPVRIDYTVERNPGLCAANMLPYEKDGKTVCMDIFEWPNKEGELPRTFVNQAEARDSCASVGKRLCTLEEWRFVCKGPGRENYPYGNRYNENHCAAREQTVQRAGRFPACRSYYGTMDMTGNVWEWTSTESTDREGFFMTAGGNWNAGNEATCGFSKYSFYPQNRYPVVGFRCCQDGAQ